MRSCLNTACACWRASNSGVISGSEFEDQRGLVMKPALTDGKSVDQIWWRRWHLSGSWRIALFRTNS